MQKQAAQQQAKAAKKAKNAGAQGAVAGTAQGPLTLPGASAAQRSAGALPSAPLPANGRHGARAAQGVPAG